MNATQVLRDQLRAAIRALLATGVLLMGIGRATAAGPLVPAACLLKTDIDPPTTGWAYVVNFESFANPTSPHGCLLVWRIAHFRPTDYVVNTCATHGPAGGVTYTADGKARFSGGHITCDINVKALLAGLSPPIAVADVEHYPYFTLIGAGQLALGQPGVRGLNPIAHYQPSVPGEFDTSLYVPFGQNGGNLISVANGITYTGKFQNEAVLNARGPFTFAVGLQGISPTLTTTHYLSSTALDVFTTTPPVRFWTNGGTFWIGASSTLTEARLAGTFEEVILDPPDGGAPPPPAARSVTYFELLLPLISGQ
jgi:hypothetical protein